MKTTLKCLAVLTVLAVSFSPGSLRAQDAPPPPPDADAQQAPPPPDDQGGQVQGDQDQGDQGASFQTFYDQLGSQGTWVQTDDYGYVFQPNVTDPDWAPYTDGHWVYTDVGWMWASDEPWGWATYHYGRWANINGMGWVWVPGYRWAPAWVSWRYGGGYCGWAPLPPATFIGVEFGDRGFDSWASFHFGGDVDVAFGIGPGCYNFVRVGDFGARNYRGHFLDRSRNFTVINNTTNITNINVARNGTTRNFRGVSVGGPQINEVNAHAQQRIPTVRLTASNRPGPSSLQGNSLAVYAPTVNPATAHQARPGRVSSTVFHPMLNRGESITNPLAVTASVRPAAPSAEAIQAAQEARSHVPSHAKIATENTTIPTSLNKPLTSLQPAATVHRTTNTQHSAATAPFTGEPTKPSTTYHPQNQFQPQTEPKPTPTYIPQTQPPAQNYHPSYTPAGGTYHPQSQGSGGAPTYHPQQQPQHQQAPTPAPAVTPGPAPQPQPQGQGGGGPGKGSGDKNKQQGQ